MQVVAKALEGFSVESGSDLQKVLRVNLYTSKDSAFRRLEAMLPVYRSRMGAILFLISALLSRGLVWYYTLHNGLFALHVSELFNC